MIPMTLTQGARDGTADRPPLNHTLEDVAEEILNGMFCTYEPPPTRKEKTRGILRTPKMLRRNRSDQSFKSVRWSDFDAKEEEEEEEDKAGMHPHLDFHCNMTGACMEAGVESGCFSPGEHEAKTGRGDVVVFDEEGNPTSIQNGKIGLPLPTPPLPSSKEKILPHLCGVKINCGDDEEHMVEVSKSNRDGPSKTYHRPKQAYDYEDETDNSLVDEEEAEAAMEARHKQQHQEILKRRMEKLRQKQERKQQRARKGSRTDDDIDWDDRASNVSGSSSFFRKVFNKKGNKEEREPASSDRKSLRSSRSPPPGRPSRKSVSFDEDDELDHVRSVRAQTNMRDEDWDESLPIIPLKPQKVMRRSQSNERSTRSFLHDRETEKASNGFSKASRARDKQRDPSPVITRTRSRSLDDKDEIKSTRWSLAPKQKKQDSRSQSPGRRRSISPSRLRTGYVGEPDGRQSSLTQNVMRNFNNMYPAHPLSRYKDDTMERESMITAHRRGLDGCAASAIESDQMERQSYITAHRQGFAESLLKKAKAGSRSGLLHPKLKQLGYVNHDDAMERESCITASRQDFNQMRGSGQSSSDLARINEHDRLERQSHIAEHRSVYDPVLSAGPANVKRNFAPRQVAQESRQVDEAKAQQSIRRTLDAFPETGSLQSAPAPSYLDENDSGNGGNANRVSMYGSGSQESYIDRQLQVAQSQRQYKNRMQQQQAHRGSPGRTSKKKARRRSSFSLPFLKRTKSPQYDQARRQSRSFAQARQMQMANTSQHPNGVYYQYPNQPPLHAHSLLYPQQLTQAGLVSSTNISQRAGKEEKKETTWEERTQQAWERIRSGLAFESTQEEITTPLDKHEASFALTGSNFGMPTEPKSMDPPTSEQPSILQSALALLSGTPTKEAEPKAEATPPNSMQRPNQLLMQQYPPMMHLTYPHQVPPTQAHIQQYHARNHQQYHARNQMLMGPVNVGNQQLTLPQMQAQNGMVYPRPQGILKESSFENSRRVTFGAPTEQLFHDFSDKDLMSPPKRKVFKGAKILTGLFGRGAKQPSLQHTNTRSTDLSSCPSAYSLTEEWDGGPYGYSAGPVYSIVNKSTSDRGYLDTLGYLRMQANRGKEGSQDPVGPIAI